MSLSADTCVKPTDGIAWRAIDDEIFLYQPSGALHIFEGPVAQKIWEELDGGTSTVGSLMQSVLNQFGVSPDQAESDLQEFLAKLLDLEIIKIES